MNIPKQSNFYDCGLFVLEYAERFMSDASTLLNKDFMLYTSENDIEVMATRY
jgi:Ulp1 family protease